MSNVIHNRVRIILMVIVAIVAHDSLPGSTVNADNNGQAYSRKQRRTQSQVQPQASAERHTLDANTNLNSLLEQLNRNQFGISAGGVSHGNKVRADAGRPRLRSLNANERLLHWLSNNSPEQEQQQQQEQELLVSSALAARHKGNQRMESESADRAFERLITMSLRQGKMDESLADKNVEAKNLHAPFFHFCKTKGKQEGPSSQDTCPAPKTKTKAKAKIKLCKKKVMQKVARLLELTKNMKQRSCLIIKKLNQLDTEIHKRWPGVKSRGHKHKTDTNKTTPPPLPPDKSQSESPPGGKQKERLDRPTPMPTTQSPFKHNRGFYFGLRPLGEDNTDESLAAALREEQKLEQKVREEHQLQRERDDKIKRARYEAAPPAAARIEYFVTTPAPRRNNWHYGNYSAMSKRNKESLDSNIPKNRPISVKRLRTQLQRVLRQHKRARHRLALHKK